MKRNAGQPGRRNLKPNEGTCTSNQPAAQRQAPASQAPTCTAAAAICHHNHQAAIGIAGTPRATLRRPRPTQRCHSWQTLCPRRTCLGVCAKAQAARSASPCAFRCRWWIGRRARRERPDIRPTLFIQSEIPRGNRARPVVHNVVEGVGPPGCNRPVVGLECPGCPRSNMRFFCGKRVVNRDIAVGSPT